MKYELNHRQITAGNKSHLLSRSSFSRCPDVQVAVPYAIGLIAVMFCCAFDAPARGEVTRREAAGALRKAVRFFHSEVSSHGGYLWCYSADLTLREAEGKASKTMIWVQPPGTPTVGEAFLDAYEATGERLYLDAARDAADALLRGQLQSGGWFYRIEFDPERRDKYAYRDRARKHAEREATEAEQNGSPGGWVVWKRRKNRGNLTMLDDDTTQSALRFLMRIDRSAGFKNQDIHEAVEYALASVLRAQYPNGAWSHNYDRFPARSPDPAYYPIKSASYPQSWSRTWTKDFSGCYMLNDRITCDVIATMLRASDIYGDERYRASAERGGRFLLLAQMPEPQPAWAQQYDRHMRPVWDRQFEPPAVTGLESQAVLQTLLLLYRETKKPKYLEPVPRAIAYLRKSALSDGRLARFYELQTNKPLYFTKKYELTYSSEDTPTHYGFIVGSRLDSIEAQYRRLLQAEPADQQKQRAEKTLRHSPALVARVRAVIDGMDERGAWVEQGRLRYHKVEPESGIIDCRTFVDNVRTLCRFLTAGQ
jgi:hypothetical protein